MSAPSFVPAVIVGPCVSAFKLAVQQISCSQVKTAAVSKVPALWPLLFLFSADFASQLNLRMNISRQLVVACLA